ncbi:MAG: hypothetical protein GEV28_05700 [Actinophytocola sp.]|uniref:hypothetical protein n=1 Tax=Actinophytocola sp. TaxID=1872138 RepID=UPI0013244802|nr:hypothetical protein [Actinophytocola sp.]MPZ79906.1 hypothetical protein [Actinophytocola sp.]
MLLVSGCEPTDGSEYIPGSYSVRESGVSLRDGGSACGDEPGTGNCPDVLLGLEPGNKVYPLCQRRGQQVGENSWWVYVDAPGGSRGWVASWFLTCPTNRLPGIDDCTADHLT